MSVILDGIAAEWCRFTHGGGHIMRDPSGRVNWQCNKCGRWATRTVEAQPERAVKCTDPGITDPCIGMTDPSGGQEDGNA